MRRHGRAVQGLVTLAVVAGLTGAVSVAATGPAGAGTGADTGTKDAPLSVRQWRRQANAICRDGSDQLSDAAEQSFGDNRRDEQPSLAQITMYAGLAEPIILQQVSSIDALAEPPKLTRKVMKLLDAARTDVERFQADPSIGLEGNPFSATALQAEKLRLKQC